MGQRLTQELNTIVKFRTKQKSAEENKKLINMIKEEKIKILELDNVNDLKNYDYHLRSAEEYTIVGQFSTPYSRLNKATMISSSIKLYCRIIIYDCLSESFHNHLLKESFKIMKFLSNDNIEAKFKDKLHLYDLFCINKNYYLFMEYFSISASLMHIIWNNNRIPIDAVKQWIFCLTDAIGTLSNYGIAHRFIRPENVILNYNNSIKLAAFEVACIFYDTETGKKLLQKRGLPIECDDYLLNHLPPECFNENYDASNVDIWSIGALACLLLTHNNPFNINDKNYFQKWRHSWERKIVNEEIRALLDEIFVDTQNRLSVFHLKEDGRLSELNVKSDKSQYNNVSLRKSTKSNVLVTKSAILSINSEFSGNVDDIYHYTFYNTIPNEMSLKEKNYSIERNQSFGKEFSIFVNDYYLEARDSNNNNCLVKIFTLNRIPLRHRNVILNESGKILTYFSQKESVLKNHIHLVREIFLGENQLFIFFDKLNNCQSLFHLFSCKKNLTKLTRKQFKGWMLQLAEIIYYLTKHAISHRYIRPEYIFIDLTSLTIKLTHFDMACFIWNPIEKIPTLRHKGLQDEQEDLWNHLPPECFNNKYDSLLVDIWSFGVVLLFCITQEIPFIVPHNNEDAQQTWNDYKVKLQKHSLNIYTGVLDNIFLPMEKRIRINDLINYLNIIDKQQPSGTAFYQRRKHSTSKGRIKSGQNGSLEKLETAGKKSSLQKELRKHSKSKTDKIDDM